MLVCSSDTRLAAPAGNLEQSLGDAAAAFLVGKENVIAEIESTYSIADELAGTWRSNDDACVRSWEERMVLDEGYSKVLPEAMAALMKAKGLTPRDFAKVVFDSPTDTRRHGQVAAQLGFEPAQVQDPFALFLNVGIAGTATASLMLASALEESNPGDRILFGSSGDGADAFILAVTDAIDSFRERHAVKKYIASKRALDSYTTYLRWRELLPLETARRPDRPHVRPSAIWRERKQLLGLWGIKCRRCGTPQYDNGALSTTPIRVCAACHAQDDFEDYNFKGRRARVFGFTHDYLAAAQESPVSVALVEFNGGGRAFFDLTDRDVADVKVGMEVETTFRKVHYDRGISNYFWKVRPVR
ncbi:MAG: 3-hydroxy-3-methylglutaryl CoA synthase [Chloroflexi bacterium]|nr:3-hydroxy-3-methylglutaryl CoA synthase [Chloroflexota bacterium]